MRTFSREEFYEMVWTKPLTHLAKEFALSDVALHKVCRKHDIPHPPLGWWAKKAAGKPVARTPLPKVGSGMAARVTIAAGDLSREPAKIATAREDARVQISAVMTDGEVSQNNIVMRTAAKLRRSKPSPINGLVEVAGSGLVQASISPASIDRFELALNRIVMAASVLGIELIAEGEGPSFATPDERVTFSISETVKREKHVLTPKELAEDAAARRRAARTNIDDEFNWRIGLSSFRRPDWDYHPTGQLGFELEHLYLMGGSPRRTFRDAKVQRLEAMSSDIAVGIAVLAVAKKEDRLRREEEARKREETRRIHEISLREKHIEKRRGLALEDILEQIEKLDRLRRLVAGLRNGNKTAFQPRATAFLAFAERRLADRELELSSVGLDMQFERARLFGQDDDYDFKGPRYY